MAPSQLDLDATEAAGSDVDPAAHAPASRLTRIRVLALAATVPLVTGYVAVAAVLALVTAIAPRAHFSTAGVLVAALPGWLAAHQVPIAISGFELGVLPLLPTVLVILLGARAAACAATRLGRFGPREAGQVICSFAAIHGVCGVAVALFLPDRFVDVDPLAAFYHPALLAAIAASVGALPRCGLAARADEIALRGLAAGGVAVALLLTVGAAVLAAGLLASIPTARESFASGGGVGMLLLCLGYLPNAVIAATAFVAGPGFAMGGLSVSPFEFGVGRAPGVPLLAALPGEQAVWWPVLCLVPVGVGIVLGRRLRYVAERRLDRLRAVAVAAGVVAVVFVVLAGIAGGRLGAGPFDPVTMRAAAVSIALVLSVGLPAAAAVWFGGPDREPAKADDSTGSTAG
jgi:hypothetical protein